MPSPVGHVIGGLATAWLADLVPGNRAWRTAAPAASFFRRSGGTLTIVCGALGALPDADLLFGIHRTGSHSLVAALLVTIVAVAVTGWVTEDQSGGSRSSRSVFRIALMCGAAYGSHLLLDSLAVDRNPPSGFQLLWPFSSRWFISGLDFFPQTERRQFLSWPSVRTNLTAIAWESVTMLPILAGLWLIRVKALARFASQLSRRNHSA